MPAFPGPPQLGRGVVVQADDELPPLCLKWRRVLINKGALQEPRPVADALHQHWLRREPVIVLDVDLAALRVAETNDAAPWQLDPSFEFSKERLAFLTTANNYDHRAGSPICGPARRAVTLGAVETGDADVVLRDGMPAWCDGGPRQPLAINGAAVVHRESIEWGSLRPDRRDTVLANLATDQLAAVAHECGPARIIAPAGSGKTRVLTARLRHLLEGRHVTPGAVTAVAYNKRAASELVERTANLPAHIRTLNSLGLAILNGSGPFESTAGRRDLVDERGVREILDSLLEVRRKANTDPWAAYIDALSAIRLGLASPQSVETVYPDAVGVAEAFDRYRSVLADRRLVDFDEQVYGAIELLLRNPEARRVAQRCTRHLLVDEFQDLTPAHVLMLRLLAAPTYDVFGVGDDDQVIYSYAAASPQFLINYDRYFPGASKYALEVNYRCPPAVIDAARNLLSYNSARIDKTIRAAEGRPADASAIQVLFRPDHEHARVAVELLRDWNQQGRTWSELAVLTRVNSALLPIQVALVATGMPCVAPVDATILRRTGIRTALAYLRIGLQPDIITAPDIVDTIRRPGRRITQAAVEQLTASGTTSITRLRRATAQVSESDAGKLALYIRDLEVAVRAVRRNTAEVLHTIRHDIGLGAAVDVLDASRREVDRSTHADDLAALEQAAAMHPDPATFEAWLAEMLGVDGTSDGVMLSTVHRVKGQEWPKVIVLGADDRTFPHRLATNEEEERRIFHVAITRASTAVVVIADTEQPSPFCAQLQRLAPAEQSQPAAREGGGRRRPAERQEDDTVAKRSVPAELGMEVRVGGMDVQVVDWTSSSAVVAVGSSRMNLYWESPVYVYGRLYELARPPAPPAKLHNALKAWRASRARDDGVGLHLVLTDAQLHTIALRRPTTLEDLAVTPFIGATKLDDFGDELLAIIDHATPSGE